MDKGHVQQELRAIVDVEEGSFEDEVNLTTMHGNTSGSSELALAVPQPVQPGRTTGAQVCHDFNVSEDLFEEQHDLYGAPALREGASEFFFRIVASDMHKTHKFLGKQVATLDHDCVVAGLQASTQGRGDACTSVTLRPHGFPRPMKLHLHVSTSSPDESALRVWGRAEMQVADLGSALLRVSAPLGVDEWVLARLSISALEDPCADDLCLKRLQSLVDSLQQLEMAEVLVLLKHRGWCLRELPPGQKFTGWMPQTEKCIWCRDGLPKQAILVCLVLSPKIFQLGLELLPHNQPMQYYNTLLALLSAGSSELGKLKPSQRARYYAQLQKDPSNWAAADAQSQLASAAAVRSQAFDADGLEDEFGYTGQCVKCMRDPGS